VFASQAPRLIARPGGAADRPEKIQILNLDGTSRIELDAEEELINLESEVDVTLNKWSRNIPDLQKPLKFVKFFGNYTNSKIAMTLLIKLSVGITPEAIHKRFDTEAV
jgi:chromosomal replication initiation ATPase DnaA